jgi:hypothetical protein
LQWYKENKNVGVLPTDTCRHRELYPRPVTPPGVWDIGFPDSPKWCGMRLQWSTYSTNIYFDIDVATDEQWVWISI